jgi:chaperone required for assembly of F1-ATPase
MRDIFKDMDADKPLDPMQSARGTRPQLRKRFYRQADTAKEKGEGGFAVLLDGKPVRTPARNVLAAPALAVAQAIAAEWEAQADVIDPAAMPLTRLANSILDGVAAAPEPVKDEVAQYLGSDLLFYRADAPERLVVRQAQAWDPVIAWWRDALGARFVLAQGVIHAAQPDGALAAARQAIPDDPWRLGAVAAITTLTGSALLALALAQGRLSAEEAWAAAHVDEDFQASQWGHDDMAVARRTSREAEMRAAATVLALADS